MIENQKQFENAAKEAASGHGNISETLNTMADFIRNNQVEAGNVLWNHTNKLRDTNLSPATKMQLSLEASAIDAAWAKTDSHDCSAAGILMRTAGENLAAAHNIEPKSQRVQKLLDAEGDIDKQIKALNCSDKQ